MSKNDQSWGDVEMLKLMKGRSAESLLLVGRGSVRHPKNIPAQIRLAGHDTSITCVLKNLSRGGACIKLSSKGRPDLKIGDGLTLILRLNGHEGELGLSSKIAWTESDKNLFGLQFAQPISEKEAA